MEHTYRCYFCGGLKEVTQEKHNMYVKDKKERANLLYHARLALSYLSNDGLRELIKRKV